jgi:DNA-directed RNA polymerase sigma subunit (sigma70/sigma32)
MRSNLKIGEMSDNQSELSRKQRSQPINSANKRSRKAGATPANKQMTKILASLSPREEMLLRLRFGIGSEVEYTLSQLSRQFSLPPQRLGRIQLNAFTKLRQGSRYFLSQT